MSTPASAMPAKSKGGGLSKKVMGMPTYAWIALGVVVIGGGLYLYRQRQKAAAAATAAAANTAANSTTATAPAPTSSGGYGGSSSGDGWSPGWPPGVAPGVTTTTPASTSSTGTNPATLATEVQETGGYLPPGVSSTVGAPTNPTPITTAAGTFTWIPGTTQLQQAISAGQTVYSQPQPGVFQAVANPTQVTEAAGNFTPLFALTTPPAASS